MKTKEYYGDIKGPCTRLTDITCPNCGYKYLTWVRKAKWYIDKYLEIEEERNGHERDI